ncbi:MAG: hypothetical protein [Caudoviricetes sp.]|nr:MAG: hypothetical protein [Caudoviricetes sp.]
MSASNSTSVPAASLTDAGFVAPSQQDILTGVITDISAALGGNANPALNTPQGQLATSETAIIGDCNDQLLALANGVDPRNATGRMQDAIGYIYYMTRQSGETAAEFEARRAATVEGNSIGVNGAIMTLLLNVPGVTGAYVVDNSNNAQATIGGVNIAANSLYCCVAGGTPQDIALAIIRKKPPGCSYTGGTTVTVQDPAAIYNGNGPSYAVSFDIAQTTQVYFAVNIKSSSAVPSTALNAIQAAITSLFTGATGSVKATIGSTIYASSYYSAIASLGSWAQIETIKVGTSASPTGDIVAMPINQSPALTAANITLNLV